MVTTIRTPVTVWFVPKSFSFDGPNGSGPSGVDVDHAHEHPDDRRDGWDDREDQQWADPERAAVLDGFLVRPLTFPRRVRLGQHTGGAAVRRGMLARRVPVLPVRRLVDVLLSRRLVGLTARSPAGRAELRLSGPRGCELAGLPLPVTGALGVRRRRRERLTGAVRVLWLTERRQHVGGVVVRRRDARLGEQLAGDRVEHRCAPGAGGSAGVRLVHVVEPEPSSGGASAISPVF